VKVTLIAKLPRSVVTLELPRFAVRADLDSDHEKEK